MKRFAQCLATFALCFVAGFGASAGCDYFTKPIPPEAWCDAACARWQMAGCPEGNDVCLDLNCLHSVSCLTACESWPHRYPTGQCVADPPAGAGPMQSCEQVRAVCDAETPGTR